MTGVSKREQNLKKGFLAVPSTIIRQTMTAYTDGICGDPRQQERGSYQ